MGQLEKYRTIVKNILTEYAKYKPSHGEIETETIFDNEKITTSWFMLDGITKSASTAVSFILRSKMAKFGFSTMAPAMASPTSWLKPESPKKTSCWDFVIPNSENIQNMLQLKGKQL